VPPGVTLIGDQWAITGRDALSLTTGTRVAWPSGLTIAATAQAPDGALLAIATTGTDLVTVRDDGARTETLALAVPGARPIGIAVDRGGRIVIAMADGRVAIGSRKDPTWTVTTVRDQLPAAHPGPPPAQSPGPGR
jgi:hypothetical protein